MHLNLKRQGLSVLVYVSVNPAKAGILADLIGFSLFHVANKAAGYHPRKLQVPPSAF